MKPTKYTPGPWFAADWSNDFGTYKVTIGAHKTEVLAAGESPIWPDGVKKIRIASTEDGENPIADALLIAAAPCLYEALHNVMLEFGPGTMSEKTFHDACAALAKARGG